MKAALDHAGIETAIFISHSMGGTITTMLLRLVPTLVKGIVYMDSFLRLAEHYLNSHELAGTVETMTNDVAFEAWVRAVCKGSTEEVVQKVIKIMTSTPKHVRISCLTALSRPHAFRYDEVYDIPAVQIGTLFAKMDPFWKHPLAQIELQQEEWRDCAHFPLKDHPEGFNEAVTKWMEAKGLMEAYGAKATV